ncbi:hypothetical protein DYY65_12010 [Nitrososphaera sp. AFS]|nr:hypothetical protein [Nitrososphaera sp. AFS]
MFVAKLSNWQSHQTKLQAGDRAAGCTSEYAAQITMCQINSSFQWLYSKLAKSAPYYSKVSLKVW